MVNRRRLKAITKERASEEAPRQDASVAEDRTMLLSRIRQWERIQALYLPGLPQFLHELEASNIPNPDEPRLKPEDVKLWLPSSIPPNRRDAVCIPGLASTEERLRTAQCRDALESIRHVLRVKSRMVLFKNKNVRGQTHSTRSRAVIDRVHGRAKGNAEKYCVAWNAKLALAGPGEWESTLRPLLDQDIRSYSDPDRVRQGPGRKGTVEDEDPGHQDTVDANWPPADGEGIDLLPEHCTCMDGTGATHQTISWIWTTETVVDKHFSHP